MNTTRILLLSILIFSLTTLSGINNLLAQDQADRVQQLLETAQTKNGKDAVPFIEEAQRICRKENCGPRLQGEIYHELSVAYFQGYISDELAIAYADSAIYFFQQSLADNDPIVANEYYNRGVMQEALGQLVGASKDIGSALERIQSNTQLPPAEVDSISAYWLQEMTKTLRKTRDFQQADFYANQGLKLAQRRWSGAQEIKGELLRSLGNIRYDRSDFQLAIRYFQEARNMFLELGMTNERELVLTEQNLGLAYTETGDYKQAREQYQRLESFLSQVPTGEKSKGQMEAQANIYINLLRAATAQGQFSEAEQYYERAKALLDAVFPNTRYKSYAELFYAWSEVLHQQGKLEEALTYCDQSIAILLPDHMMDQEVTVLGPLKYLLKVLRVKTEVLQQLNRQTEALEVYEQFHQIISVYRQRQLSGWSKYYLTSDVIPIYEAAIGLCIERYEETGDRRFLEKAYSFNNRNKAIVLREALQHEQAIEFANIPTDERKKEAAFRQELSELNQKLLARPKANLRDSLNVVLKQKESQYQAFIRDLEQKYPEYYQLKFAEQGQIKVTEIQAHLDTDQALVEYFAGQKYWYIFLITAADFQVFQVPREGVSASDIQLYHELLTNGIAEDCEKTFLSIAYRLYQQFLATPLAAVKQETTNRLVIIPDGLLHYVSFESLLQRPRTSIQGSRDFLLERYAISYHYSPYFFAYPLQQRPNKYDKKSFAGFGMEYDDNTLQYLDSILRKDDWTPEDETPFPCSRNDTTRSLGKLYYSDDEVRSIADLLAGDYWVNEEVTKATFFERFPYYDILHLAVHGSYDLDYPMNSALAFTKTPEDDALLRAYEVYSMQFDCEMITLSACNTSFGKLMPGEGAMTLARAFNYAGVPSIVASLWSISDRSASIIMPQFYELLKTGVSKDVALQQAKLAYLQDDNLSTPSTRLPEFWGPAIIIGDTSPMALSSKWWAQPILLAIIAIIGIALFLYFQRR